MEAKISGLRCTPEELLHQLRPYGGRLVKEYETFQFEYGIDLWEVAWGESFVLSRESDGRYSGWSLKRMWERINATKPSGWVLLE